MYFISCICVNYECYGMLAELNKVLSFNKYNKKQQHCFLVMLCLLLKNVLIGTNNPFDYN